MTFRPLVFQIGSPIFGPLVFHIIGSPTFGLLVTAIHLFVSLLHIGEFMQVNSYGIPFIGFQSTSVSCIGLLQLLGVVSLVLLLLIFRSFLSYHRPARVDDHFARPLVVTI